MIVNEELTAEAPLSPADRADLERQIADDILGYGPLEPYLQDPSVTEVMVNGSDQVYIERAGRIEETQTSFLDDAHLLRIIDRIVSQVGRRIDEASPMVDARLPDGSRVNAIIPPLALAVGFAHDPQVRPRRAHARAPRRAGHAHGADGRVPGRVRARQAQHPHLRRHRHRKDDAAERRFRPRAAYRAGRHRRGRRRAAAAAATRRLARVTAAQRRGRGRDRDP